ncbi:MAG: hypothetical protein GNW80_16455 [Asgard group archaeon]|nr:hypothetical protein [Asgard group archaeon]
MKTIEIKGSPFEMGVEYGKQCKKEIKSLLKFIYLLITRASMPDFKTGRMRIYYIIPTFFTTKKKKRNLYSTIKKHEDWIKSYFPDSIEFMKGISEGARVNYEDILYLNILTELSYALYHCSSWSAVGNVTETGEPFLGMNSDEEKIMSRYEIILHIEPKNGNKIIGTVIAGTILFGAAMNDKGLAAAFPILLWVKSGGDYFEHMPVIALYRILFECGNIDEALELYKTLPNPAASVSMHLADKKKIARIEFTKKESHIEISENGTFYNCNMAMSEKIKKYDKIYSLKEKATNNAFPRTKRMNELLKKFSGSINEDVMKKIASDHGDEDTRNKSICQHHKIFSGGIVTLTSFIAKPKELKMWISDGTPCNHEYKEFEF